MSKRNLLLLLPLLLCPFAGARSADDVLKLYFKSIGIQQGLSHQMVNAIVKDPQGFIWIGTAEGAEPVRRHRIPRLQTRTGKSLFALDIVDQLSLHHTGRPVVHRHGEGRKRLQRAKGKLRTDIGGKRLPQPAGQPAHTLFLRRLEGLSLDRHARRTDPVRPAGTA